MNKYSISLILVAVVAGIYFYFNQKTKLLEQSLGQKLENQLKTAVKTAVKEEFQNHKLNDSSKS